MKVAPKVIFLFKEKDGFASAISDAFHPNASSSLRRLEDLFELSLEGYGIKNHKGSGNIIHFVDYQGNYQVSVVVMQHYEPPVLACAVNEVLAKIIEDRSSFMPTLLIPFIAASSQIKGESKSLRSSEDKTSIYGIQIGQETDVTQALLTRTQKPPTSLQIQHETLACFLHFVRVLNLPTFFLVGQTGQHSQNRSSEEELEILNVIGQILASTTCLHFSKERVVLNPTQTTRESKEPWRALYG